jgi:hypothetical protein
MCAPYAVGARLQLVECDRQPLCILPSCRPGKEAAFWFARPRLRPDANAGEDEQVSQGFPGGGGVCAAVLGRCSARRRQ